MSNARSPIKKLVRRHWFVLAAAVVFTGDVILASSNRWSDPRLLEAGILFDLSVVVPALYLWCYRSRVKPAIARAVALSCLGIWVAGHIVPNEHHQVLSAVGFIRYVGLAALIAVELKLAAMILRATFGSDNDAGPTVMATAKDAGMPEWAARLMVWESSLWRKAWLALKRMSHRR